jgi:Mrp family chromosome partitioning ATPase
MSLLMTSIPRSPSYNPARGERLKDYIRYSELRQLVYRIVDLQRRQRDSFSSLAVLSLFPSEGKTLFCAALAAAYADTCRTRVLAVDTTTTRHSKSLSLKQCIDPANQMIDFVFLTDHRHSGFSDDGLHQPIGGSLEQDGDGAMALGPMLNEHYLVTKVTKSAAKQYGLVILDTAPMTARNKNNFDPALVAQLSDASILMIGSNTLNAPDVDERLRLLEDPGFRIIGAVSNEEFSR